MIHAIHLSDARYADLTSDDYDVSCRMADALDRRVRKAFADTDADFVRVLTPNGEVYDTYSRASV